jgi:CheY-like chemotaxis protein
MLDTGRMLVVTDDPESADYVVASVELDGYDVLACEGPGATRDCPRLHGIRCSLRERVDVAVVDLDCDDDALVCTKIPDDGGTVYVRSARAPSLERADLARAVADARRHVADLQRDPVQHRPVRAIDLD